MVYYGCFPRGRRNKDKDKRKDKKMETREFKLEAMNGKVKSHYGRAVVRAYGNTGLYGLISYGTLVAAGTMATKNTPAAMYRIYDADFEEEYGGWSATTAGHLESFSAFLGGGYVNKKQWKGKEYTTIDEVLKAITAIAA